MLEKESRTYCQESQGVASKGKIHCFIIPILLMKEMSLRYNLPKNSHIQKLVELRFKLRSI